MVESMARESVTRQSPLAGWTERFSAVAPAIVLAEVPFRAMVNLRMRTGTAAASAVEAALGFALPLGPTPAGGAAGDRAVWLAPDEFLLSSGSRSASELTGVLRSALGDTANGAAVNVSAQYTSISLAGPESRDLLAGGCSTDLSPDAAPTGSSVHTPLAQASVVIVVTDAAAGAFLLIVRASFADYLASWLTMAAREYA
ncbi:MAG TPA: sarcosine oxidase subunit gamma [Microbacteriaceae bacterium]|nr:sarcosine oxidase subunit gamma [Microbacteriaceae bacterium]